MEEIFCNSKKQENLKFRLILCYANKKEDSNEIIGCKYLENTLRLFCTE